MTVYQSRIEDGVVETQTSRRLASIHMDSLSRMPGTRTTPSFLHGLAEETSRLQSPTVLKNPFPDRQPQIRLDQRQIDIR